VHHAARFAYQPRRYEALLRLHDGRPRYRDRHPDLGCSAQSLCGRR
jgi:hypothetical protein